MRRLRLVLGREMSANNKIQATESLAVVVVVIIITIIIIYQIYLNNTVHHLQAVTFTGKGKSAGLHLLHKS